MKLTKIKIENFKSIDKIEFDVKKHGKSHTTMFVGINEVGKSNILEAMSYFDVPTIEVNLKDFNNKNNTNSKDVNLYFEMEFENKETYLDKLQQILAPSKKFLDDFKISNVSKTVFLEKEKTAFQERYEFGFEGIASSDFFFKIDPSQIEIKHKSETTEESEEQYIQLDDGKLKELVAPILEQVTKTHEIGLTFWKPEKEFLITEPIDLNTFKDNPSVNIPLKNIFALGGYKTVEEIKSKIEEIADTSLRRGLQTQLTSKATKYFGGVWEHKIGIDIEISEGLQCTVHIKDEGKSNENKFFNMNSRSQGFHQFVSLILSLSIQNNSLNMKNKLILIDEPENHLHPLGIRNMMQELLRIGENNYVFLATHSCFMIDKVEKERNFIIKKDSKQNTIHSQIKQEDDIFDDEVLADAFGINVYKDFLTPNKLLVEGSSDKKIIRKAIKKLKIRTPIGISNGYGSNVVEVASRLGFEKIQAIVILDDDDSGESAQKKIIKIGGIYSTSNVLTIRDIEPSIIAKGTIEDTLGLEFIQSELDRYWSGTFSGETNNLTLVETEPFIKQIKIHVQKEKTEENVNKFLERFKIRLSEDFNPTNIDTNFPLLKKLIEKIESKFKSGSE